MTLNALVDVLRRFGGLAAVALLGGMLSACGAMKYPEAPSAAATPDYKYLIGPLDTLNIIVWRNPELSLVVPVRPDGRISTPLVEDLVAQGRNPTDLARDVEKALSKYTRDPVVTIVVSGFTGAINEQIRVVGEATRPAAIPYRQNMTVLDVMIAPGQWLAVDIRDTDPRSVRISATREGSRGASLVFSVERERRSERGAGGAKDEPSRHRPRDKRNK